MLYRTVARPQHDGRQILLGFVIERQGGHQRQIAPSLIVSIEEGELLLPMGGIVGRVWVDPCDPLTSTDPEGFYAFP